MFCSRPQVSSNSIESVFSFVLDLFPCQRKESRAASPSSWVFSCKDFPEQIFVLFCAWCVIVFYCSLFSAFYLFHAKAEN
jgi:hypothetical protein